MSTELLGWRTQLWGLGVYLWSEVWRTWLCRFVHISNGWPQCLRIRTGITPSVDSCLRRSYGGWAADDAQALPTRWPFDWGCHRRPCLFAEGSWFWSPGWLLRRLFDAGPTDGEDHGQVCRGWTSDEWEESLWQHFQQFLLGSASWWKKGIGES